MIMDGPISSTLLHSSNSNKILHVKPANLANFLRFYPLFFISLPNPKRNFWYTFIVGNMNPHRKIRKRLMGYSYYQLVLGWNFIGFVCSQLSSYVGFMYKPKFIIYLGGVSCFAGKFYTLTTGANERRWDKMKDRLYTVIDSFRVFNA